MAFNKSLATVGSDAIMDSCLGILALLLGRAEIGGVVVGTCWGGCCGETSEGVAGAADCGGGV